jgi:hypothetical protein
MMIESHAGVTLNAAAQSFRFKSGFARSQSAMLSCRGETFAICADSATYNTPRCARFENRVILEREYSIKKGGALEDVDFCARVVYHTRPG